MALPLQAAPLTNFLSSSIRRPSLSPSPFKHPSPLPLEIDRGIHQQVSCCINLKATEELVVARRSANYSPTIWDYNFVQSLKCDYAVSN